MTTYGYARVSTRDQDLTIQRDKLQAAGCSMIREEKASGTTRVGREELDTLLSFLRKDDVLVVTRIDRLARSVGDLQDIVKAIRSKEAHLRVTEQAVDTSSAGGKAFLNMLGVFAEFETDLRKERQLEGIAKAKTLTGDAKVYKGGKRRLDRESVRVMQAAGEGAASIAKALGCSRMQVYRVIKEMDTVAAGHA